MSERAPSSADASAPSPADFIDAAIAHPGAADLRALRPKSVVALQGSQACLFAADAVIGPVGPTVADRIEIAAVVCEASGAAPLAAVYRTWWRQQARDDRDADHAANVCEARPAARAAMLEFARVLAERPLDRGRAWIDRLLSAGLVPSDVVLLGQLIGFVSCQLRVVTAVRGILVAEAAAAAEAVAGPAAFWPEAPAGADGGRAGARAGAATGERPTIGPVPAADTAVLNVRGFTDGLVRWRSWLPIVDLATADDDQRKVAEESNYTANPEYFLLLSHQPDVLRQRSRAMQAAMYDPRGLTRAERELGAVVTSRINGCVYCAAGHARLVIQLQHRNDTIATVFEDPHGAGTTAREQAVIAFAIALTRDGGRLGPDAIAALAAAGLGRLETLDLIHAVAMFAWANRLMLNLGEPVFPPGYVPA